MVEQNTNETPEAKQSINVDQEIMKFIVKVLRDDDTKKSPAMVTAIAELFKSLSY